MFIFSKFKTIEWEKQERKTERMRKCAERPTISWVLMLRAVLNVETHFCGNVCLIQSPIYYTVCGMPLASNSVIVAVAKTKTKTSTSTCPVILAILRLRPQTTFGRGFLFIENRKITFSKGQVAHAYPSAFRNTLINLLWEQVLLVFMHDTSTAINRLC